MVFVVFGRLLFENVPKTRRAHIQTTATRTAKEILFHASSASSAFKVLIGLVAGSRVSRVPNINMNHKEYYYSATRTDVGSKGGQILGCISALPVDGFRSLSINLVERAGFEPAPALPRKLQRSSCAPYPTVPITP